MKYLKFLLLLVSLSSVPCYSLSQEEIEDLPNLSKNELIEIIMIQDESLTKIEKEEEKKEQILAERKSLQDERELDLNERESLIVNRENRAAEREASLVMREQLSVESLKIRKEMERANFWKGFGYGSLTGFVVGGFSGGAVVGQFK